MRTESPTRETNRLSWGALTTDRCLRAAAIVFVLLTIPIGTAAQRETVLDLTVLPLVLLVLARPGLRTNPAERWFWNLWSAAIATWLAVRVLYVVAPESWVGTPLDLTSDGLYVLFYLLIFLATSVRPHEPVTDTRFGIPWLHTAAITVLSFALLSYFVLLPLQARSAEYESWLPSLYHYVTLDAILVLRFIQLYQAAPSRRWRWTYGLLIATCSLWLLTDLMESLHYAGTVELRVLDRLDFIWHLPLLALVAATAAGVRRGRDEEDSGTHATLALALRTGNHLVGFAIFLPLMHLGLHASGLLERALQRPRELLVLIATLLIAGLAVGEQRRQRAENQTAALDRRRTAARLRERTSYLDTLIEHSPLAIVSMDTNYEVRLCNPAFERLFGFRHDEIAGRSLLPFIGTEEIVPDMLALGDRVLEGRVVREYVQRRHRDGYLIDTEVHCVPMEVDGQMMGLLALYRDRREELEAERAQRAGEARLQMFAAAAFEGIVVIRDGRILDVNERFAAMFGTEAHNLLGSPLASIMPTHEDQVSDPIERALDQPLQVTCRRVDGSTFDGEVQARPYDDGDAAQASYVAAVRDLTARLSLEAQLRQAQKMEALGALAGGIAHDFNNLLTVILGHACLIAAQTRDAETERHAQEIEGAADLAASMTRQLLLFARKQPTQNERLDLNTLAASTTETMLRRLLRENVALNLELAPELEPIRADRGQLEQLILNLAVNAQDAMRDGGQLHIATDNVVLDAPRAAFGLSISAGTYVCLTVRDNGQGIAPDTVATVFDPFFTTKEDGTGLGLATVYGIVEQCRGLVEIESQPGHTVFRVYIPRDEQDVEADGDGVESATAADEETTETPHARATILVVEDVTAIGAMLERFLLREGFAVLRSSRPLHALEMAARHPGTIDLLLTDVVMPEMDGPSLAARLTTVRPDTKVLYMSGYSDDATFREQVEVGGGAFLAKPFGLADLLRMIHELLALDDVTRGLPSETDERHHDRPHGMPPSV